MKEEVIDFIVHILASYCKKVKSAAIGYWHYNLYIFVTSMRALHWMGFILRGREQETEKLFPFANCRAPDKRGY